MTTPRHCPGFENFKNLKAFTCKCPDCGKEVTFYNDPSVQAQVFKSREAKDIFSWYISDAREDFRLPNTRYLCPNVDRWR